MAVVSVPLWPLELEVARGTGFGHTNRGGFIIVLGTALVDSLKAEFGVGISMALVTSDIECVLPCLFFSNFVFFLASDSRDGLKLFNVTTVDCPPLPNNACSASFVVLCPCILLAIPLADDCGIVVPESKLLNMTSSNSAYNFFFFLSYPF